jgi:hypothetical protein
MPPVRRVLPPLLHVPAPTGGLIFRREWWTFYDELAPRLGEYLQAWDMTFKGRIA